MKRVFRRRYFSFLRLSVIAIALVFVISYVSLHKLLFVGNNLKVEGENMCTLAKEIRTDLIKRLDAKRFKFVSKDNVPLTGLIIERQNPEGTFVICHGYKCCKELFSGYVDLFSNFNAVLFDFRAHGENKRGLTTIGCHEYKDVIAVVQWLKKNRPELAKPPLILLGVSMGGACALKAVDHDPTLCDALIIDSSFSSLRSLLTKTFALKSGLPTFPFFTIMTQMFNYLGSCVLDSFKPINSIKKIKQPLLLIHSCIDDIVPVQESLLMYAQGVKTGAKLWIAPECKHGWLHKRYPHMYKKKVLKFINKRVLSA